MKRGASSEERQVARVIVRVLAVVLSFAGLCGCARTSGSVIASSGTTIGVEISQDQATQTPRAVLGYKRAEFAYVPTNRGTATKTTTVEDGGKKTTVEEDGLPTAGDGAKDSANVLMELRYGGIFYWGAGSGIYQRLAVGEKAVEQPGASLMFTKDDAGKVDKDAAAALSVAQRNLSQQISATDWEKAVADATKRATERRAKIDVILPKLRNDKDQSLVDSVKLLDLVNKAQIDRNDDLVRVMLQFNKIRDLRSFLDEPGQGFVDKLLIASEKP